MAKKIEQILAETPGVESYSTIAGFSLLTNANSSNMAFVFVQLKEWHERHGKAESARRHRCPAQPGLLPPRFRRGSPSPSGRRPFRGSAMARASRMMLRTWAAILRNIWPSRPSGSSRPRTSGRKFARAFSPCGASVPQLFADVDRDRVLKLGLQLQDVNNTLGSFLGGTYVNDFNRFGRVYKVYVQAEGTYRTKPDDISFFYVRTPGGQMVPLSTLVQMRQASGPEFTNRFNLFRAAEVTGTPAPGYSSSQALKALEEVAKEVLPLGHGVLVERAQLPGKAGRGQGGRHFLLALVLVFLILAAQYESWSPPFSVLLGTPFAAFGAFLGLFIARQISPVFENNVFAQIGLVDPHRPGGQERDPHRGIRPSRASQGPASGRIGARCRQAAVPADPDDRLCVHSGRGAPLTASGAGAASRKVMGTTVLSGMLVATILGVILVPSLYIIVERLTGGEKKAQAHAAAAGAQPEIGALANTAGTRDQAPHRNLRCSGRPVLQGGSRVRTLPEVAVPETYRFTDTTVYSPDSLAKLDSAAAIDRGCPLVGGLRRRHAARP